MSDGKLRALVEEMRAAWEPFAEVIENEESVGREYDNGDERIWISQAYGCQLAEVAVTDFRRLEAALTAASHLSASSNEGWRVKPLPSKQALEAVLRYDRETGKLFWLMRPDVHGWDARLGGKEAFTYVDSNGYKRGKVDGVGYQAHRVIWKLVYGVDPLTIDHINGDKSDNRLQNLRDCTVADNSRNYVKPAGAASQYRGVCWVKRDQKWAARISNGRGGKTSLGNFDSEQDAAKAYDRAAQALHGAFAVLNFPAGIIRIKPLEWADHRGHTFPDTWTAKTPCGVYEIEERSASDAPYYIATGPLHVFIADRDGLDEAKAAAQADYEARIRSAILPPPPSPGEEQPPSVHGAGKMSELPERIGLVATPFGLRPWTWEADAGQPATAEYIRSDLVEAQAQATPATPSGYVKLPESADEAALMNLISGEWLFYNAPDRLTPSARRWYERRDGKGASTSPTPPGGSDE